jgi:predicted negative regulator of RcsB-dependent stress response
MKTERRHELQTNALADALGHAVDAVKPYTQIAVGVVLAAAVIFGVVKYLSVRSEENVVDAWNMYLQASTGGSESTEELSQLIEQYPDTAAAQWSHLFLADQALGDGINQLFQNRSEANEKLRQAEQHYLAVQQKASDPLLEERATLGLGRVYESQVQLDKAKQAYQQLLDRWPNGAFAATARERLNDLSQQSTKEFYDWFAGSEPKTPAEGPGTPGSRPSFNFEEEPAGIQLNLNSATPSSETDETSQTPDPEPKEPVSTASREPPAEEPATP